jgi:hypothetical protein
MENNYFYNPCPYVRSPYCFGCPAAQNSYNYRSALQNAYGYRTADYNELIGGEEEVGNNGLSGYTVEYGTEEQIRTPQDVDRVMGIINQELAGPISEIQRIGVDQRLIRYLVRAVVSYIDTNFNRFTGSMDQRLDSVLREVRRQLPWVLEIMQVFGVSPATETRILTEIARVALENLRTQPMQPPVAMPRY